jgi:hypothetical protein
MRPILGRAILGGVVGTAAMTMLMYVVAPMMGVHMDIAAMLGTMLGGWVAGFFAHLMNGVIVFPLLYALLIYRVLRGSPVVRGTLFGVSLWLMAQLFVLPIMGAGVFSAHAGGALASVASLMGHIIYGGLLGTIAGRPRLNREAPLLSAV